MRTLDLRPFCRSFYIIKDPLKGGMEFEMLSHLRRMHMWQLSRTNGDFALNITPSVCIEPLHLIGSVETVFKVEGFVSPERSNGLT